MKRYRAGMRRNAAIGLTTRAMPAATPPSIVSTQTKPLFFPSVRAIRNKLNIDQKTINDRKEAETQGFMLETTLKPYKDIDWKTLTALNNNPDPKFNIALAFRQLSENAEKIGTLNISPELLDSLLTERGK